MKFNSQICTTREQSERLLSLGLKQETADMCYLLEWETGAFTLYPVGWNNFHRTTADIPAWSLHRMLCMLPRYVRKEYTEYGRKYIAALDLIIDEDLHIGYKEGVDEPCYDEIFYAKDIYTSLCDCIEWLIKEGYFQKEYLVDLTGTDSHKDMVDAFGYAFAAMKEKEE